MGFNRRKLEAERKDKADAEASARPATDAQVLEDAERLIAIWNERQAGECPYCSRRPSALRSRPGTISYRSIARPAAPRSAQQAQDFRRCHAPPSLVGQFTSKPGEFCLRTSMERSGARRFVRRAAALTFYRLEASRLGAFATDLGALLHWLPRGLGKHPIRSRPHTGSSARPLH